MAYTEEFRTAEIARIRQAAQQGPYTPDWKSLCAWRAPDWYRDAKFGIFTHWGLYSVPAHGHEWYSRNMYLEGDPLFDYHVKTFGPQKDFGYKDFIPMFKAEKFDPDEWLRLFREAGARYYVPVAEHHDGFQMYDSALSDWNAMQMGPKRDVVGELHAAAGRAGIIPCLSSHRAEHWWFMGGGRTFDSDIREPMRRGDFYWPAQPMGDMQDPTSKPCPTEEYLDDWLMRTVELVDRYAPRMVYFDWWIMHEAFEPYIRLFAAYYYNYGHAHGFVPVIAYKADAFCLHAAMPDVERGQLSEIQAEPWQTDMACALNSWCYTDGNSYRDPMGIIQDMLDIVSKNGNLLLNVGPRADGTIGDDDRAILKQIGAYLKRNGEAVYGTRPWRLYGEGPTKVKSGGFTDGEKKEFTVSDFRFTQKENAVYVCAMKPDPDGEYLVRTFRSIKDPAFDGWHKQLYGVTRPDGLPVTWERTEEGLRLKTARAEELPPVFRLQLFP